MNNEHKEKNSESKGSSVGAMLKIAAGAAALTAATYYLFGPNGKSNRKHLRGWMIKMKGEIVERIEETKDLTEAAYHQIVDSVVATYLAAGKINADELKEFAEELKAEWKNILKSHLEEAKENLEKKAKAIHADHSSKAKSKGKSSK